MGPWWTDQVWVTYFSLVYSNLNHNKEAGWAYMTFQWMTVTRWIGHLHGWLVCISSSGCPQLPLIPHELWTDISVSGHLTRAECHLLTSIMFWIGGGGDSSLYICIYTFSASKSLGQWQCGQCNAQHSTVESKTLHLKVRSINVDKALQLKLNHDEISVFGWLNVEY